MSAPTPDEERIADLVVAKLEPRLRAMLNQLVEGHRSGAVYGPAMDGMDYERRAQQASHWKGASIQRPVPPLKQPRMRLTCGHVITVKRHGAHGLSDAELLAQEWYCQECRENYKVKHPPPPLTPEEEARIAAITDATLERIQAKRMRSRLTAAAPSAPLPAPPDDAKATIADRLRKRRPGTPKRRR